jgi:hypothetical protein
MKAPINSTLTAIAGSLVFALVLLVAGQASAGNTMGNWGSGGGSSNCGCPGSGGHQHHRPPNNNIDIKVSVVTKATANANANASVLGAAASRVSGGGGSSDYLAPGATGLIQNLDVDSAGLTRTAYEATRTKITKVIIQAVCLDDKDVPHPASQTSPDRDIDEAFDGELFRCIAGTHMQATIAEYHGQLAFDHGWTLSCDKNQALYRDKDGKVECRAQIPARDCNERSLLRRFGAGVKVVTMITTEKYTAYHEETVQSSGSGALSLDGGVGGVMY